MVPRDNVIPESKAPILVMVTRDNVIPESKAPILVMVTRDQSVLQVSKAPILGMEATKVQYVMVGSKALIQVVHKLYPLP
jgi:hypothetical protein